MVQTFLNHLLLRVLGKKCFNSQLAEASCCQRKRWHHLPYV